MNDVVAKLDLFLLHVKQAAADGLSMREVGGILVEAMRLGVAAAAELQASGPQKKQQVMAAVGYVFDLVAPAVPWPVWLLPLKWLLVPVLRKIVLAIADAAVEAFYQDFKRLEAA